MITLLVSSAFATPFDLDLQFTGAPSHAYVNAPPPLSIIAIFESWSVSGVPGPPLGTSSFDVRFTLPETYIANDVPAGLSYRYAMRCEWGSSGTSAGSQSLPLTGQITFEPEPLPLDGSTTLNITGASGDRVFLNVAGPLVGGESLRTAHVVVPAGTFNALPIAAAIGVCSVNLSLDGSTTFEDQPLLLEQSRTLDALAAQLAEDAQAAYVTQFGAGATPGPSAIEAGLQPLFDALTDGGCTTNPLDQNGVAGAYNRTLITGTDDVGAVSGTRTPQTRAFGATLGDGTLLGEAAGLFSYHSSERKLFAETEDGGFFAGRWKRVAGKRGVFYGVSGFCDGDADAPTALSSWFDGPLP